MGLTPERRKLNRVHYRTGAGYAVIVPILFATHSYIPGIVGGILILANYVSCMIQIRLFSSEDE